MIASALLLALAVPAPAVEQSPPAATASFQSSGGATARAKVSIRIVSGAQFGKSRATVQVEGAALRTTRSELNRPLNLLEFQ